MDKLNALSRGQQIILVAGVLLLIDTLLDWQHVSVSVGGIGVASGGQSAWHGFWGVLLGLMTLVLVAWTAARAFNSNLKLSDSVPEGLVALVLGILIPVFALIKIVSDSYVHWPAWVGLILGAVIAYGAWLVYSESGETLPGTQAQDPAA